MNNTNEVDAWAEFQRDRKDTGYPKWPNEAMVKLLFGGYLSNPIKIKKGWKCLDVGCGFGNNLMPFLDMGLACSGVEIHEDMVAITNKLLKERGYEAAIVTGSNREIPFDDGTFDLLLSVNALHYEGTEAYIDAALKSFSSKLKPGGVLYISTVGPRHAIQEKSKLLGHHQYKIQNWDFRNGETFFFFDTEKYLAKYCEKYFSTVETSRVTEKLSTVNLDFLLAVCTK